MRAQKTRKNQKIHWITFGVILIQLFSSATSFAVGLCEFQRADTPEMQAAQQSFVTATATSCNNPTGALMSAGTAFAQGGALQGACAMAGGVSLTTQCDNVVVEPYVPACPVNQADLARAKTNINTAICSDQCRMSKIQKIQSEINCAMAIQSAMAQKLQSINSLFQKNVQQCQKDMLTYTTNQQESETQALNIDNKLTGSPGTPGLLQVQAETQKALNTMPAEIQKLEVQNRALIQKQDNLTSNIKKAKSAEMASCFKDRPMNQYRCSTNGDPETPQNYMLCLYKQSQVIGKNGIVERDNTSQLKADGNVNALRGLLTQMFADAPTPGATGGYSSGITQDPATLLRLYGAQLEKYALPKGQNARQFVSGILNVCKNRADEIVKGQLDDSNSDLNKTRLEIKNEKTQLTADISQIKNGYTQNYTNAMGALTGVASPPVFSSGCNKDATASISCLSGIKTSMENLLFGKGAGTQQSIKIQGNSKTMVVTCQGINSCVKELGVKKVELQTYVKKLAQEKQQGAQNAVRTTQTAMTAYAAQLNQQSSVAKTKMQEISDSMRSMGLQGLNFGPFPPAKMETLPASDRPDDKGNLIPTVPGNILGLMGNQVNPPLLDTTRGTPDLGSASQQYATSMGRLRGQLQQIESKPDACAAEHNSQLMSNLNQLGSSISEGSCYGTRHCPDPSMPDRNVQSVFNVAAFSGAPAVNPMSLSSLEQGVSVMCNKPMVGSQMVNTGSDVYQMRQMENQSNCNRFMNGLVNAKNDIRFGSNGRPGSGFGTAGSARGNYP